MASCNYAFALNSSAISSSASGKFGHFNASLIPFVKKNVKALPQIPKLREVGQGIKEASIKIIDAVADFTFEFVDQEWLPSQRNFVPVDEIEEAIPVVSVKGCIPDDFPEGVYIRNVAEADKMDPGADRQVNLKAVRAARAAKAEAARKAAAEKAAADKILRVEGLKNVEPVEVPTVPVAINTEKAPATSRSIIIAPKKPDAKGRAKKVITPSQQEAALKLKNKRDSEEPEEQPLLKKSKKNVGDSSGVADPAADHDKEVSVVAEDIGDDVVQLPPSSQSTRHVPAGSSGPSALPVYFDEQFLNNPALPGWRQKMHEAITDASPIPYFVRPWKHGAHIAVGEALACRIATTNPAFPQNLSPGAQVDTAIADFGLAAHSIATALFAAREGVNRALKSEKAAVEISKRQNTELNNTLESLKMQLDMSKSLDEERLKLMKSAEERASDAEKALEDSQRAYSELKAAADDAALKAVQELDAAKNVSVLSEKRAETAEEKVAAAEERAATAEKRAAEAEKNALKCYEQGVYHMARCWWRDMLKSFTPDLEELAVYSLQNSTSEELLAYHSVIPFTPAEIERINEKRWGKGLDELEFGEVASVNMRAIQDDMEAIMAEEPAAEPVSADNAAAVDSAGVEANVGEDPQIKAAGGVEDSAKVIDPSGGSEAKEGEGSQTAKAADGAAS